MKLNYTVINFVLNFVTWRWLFSRFIYDYDITCTRNLNHRAAIFMRTFGPYQRGKLTCNIRWMLVTFWADHPPCGLSSAGSSSKYGGRRWMKLPSLKNVWLDVLFFNKLRSSSKQSSTTIPGLNSNNTSCLIHDHYIKRDYDSVIILYGLYSTHNVPPSLLPSSNIISNNFSNAFSNTTIFWILAFPFVSWINKSNPYNK